MSTDIELKWEWPADRVIEEKLVVKIDSIKPQKSGLFSFKKSPSFAGNLPEPTTVRGTIVKAEGSLNGKSVELVAPQPELEGLAADDYAVFGIVSDTTCICVAPVSGPDANLAEIDCK